MSKTILITGAASDFGRAAAEMLCAAGHQVFATMRDPAGRNCERANALWAQAIHVLPMDVTDDTSVATGVREILAKTARIDVLVNNASVGSIGACEAFTCDQMRAALDTNVVGMFRVVRAVMPAMRSQGDGLIVNVGSILGRIALPQFGLSGICKRAAEALADALRCEASAFGVESVILQTSGNPAALARALLGIIEMPQGTRPDRTTLGNPFGVDEINCLVRPIQKAALRNLGLIPPDSSF